MTSEEVLKRLRHFQEGEQREKLQEMIAKGCDKDFALRAASACLDEATAQWYEMCGQDTKKLLVPAETRDMQNQQLMIYALGAMDAMSIFIESAFRNRNSAGLVN